MNKLFLLGAFALCLLGACGDNDLPPDDVDDAQSALMCPATGCPKPVTTTVDCGSSADASCYECGNPNGVMCCVGTCTIIPVGKRYK